MPHIFLKLMLQRVQTLWILLAVIAAVIGYFNAPNFILNAGFSEVEIGTILVALLGIISICSFKNRKRQILLNRISIFINALLIGLLIYWLLNLPGGGLPPEKGIELIFPAIAIVALFIANKRIRKDEKLVKSVDRFR